MKKIFRHAFLVFLVMLALAISLWIARKPQESKIPSVAVIGAQKQSGSQNKNSSNSESEPIQSPIILKKISKAGVTISLRHQDGSKTLSEWKSLYPDAEVIINGVYFHEDNSPSGFFVSSGIRKGNRQFDLKKSGLMVFGEKFEIIDTSKQKAELKKYTDAAQSYPFLIKYNESAIAEDSGLVARRSFIGYDAEGNVYFGIVPNTELSLYALSKEIKSLEIPWSMVMNLDGGPSSGLWFKDGDKEYFYSSYVAVPNVIVAEARK